MYFRQEQFFPINFYLNKDFKTLKTITKSAIQIEYNEDNLEII